MTDEKQAVVNESDAVESQQTEESDAQDDVESLLNEYEQETSTKGEQPDESKQSDAKQPYIPQEVQELLEQKTQSDIKTAASTIKEVSGVNLPDEVFEGILHRSVDGDPRALRLWQNRSRDPKGWDRYVQSIGRNFAKQMKELPDQKATEDNKAFDSAVRNASNSSSQPDSDDMPDLGPMSDHDFIAYKRSLLSRKG